jgi:predicted Zn-dependent protease
MTINDPSHQVSAGRSDDPHAALVQADAGMRTGKARGKLILLAALCLLAVALGMRALRQSPWYQERRFSTMTLAQLQRERAGRLDNPRLLYAIGLRLIAQSQFVEADPYLRNAVGLDPDDPRLRDAWAETLVRSGQVTAAFGELRQFVGTHPNSAVGHLAFGKFYLTQASLIRASEELHRAVELEPSLGEAWSYLASAERGQGHVEEAEQASEHAVALRPNNATDRLGQALLLMEMGKTDRARSAFATALRLDPRSAATHREYARCLLKLGKEPGELTQAETEARQALSLDPRDPAALLILGQTLVAEGRPQDAIPYLEAIALHSPADPASALTVAQTYRRLHNVGMAERWDAVYGERSRRQALKESLTAVIERNPRNRAAQRQLARLLAENGDVGGCLRHEAAAIHRGLDAPPALVAAANDLIAVGRAIDALPLAMKAVDAARNNPMAREAMGDALLALDKPYDAAECYARASHGLPERAPLYQRKLDEYYLQHEGHLPRHAMKADSMKPTSLNEALATRSKK